MLQLSILRKLKLLFLCRNMLVKLLKMIQKQKKGLLMAQTTLELVQAYQSGNHQASILLIMRKVIQKSQMQWVRIFSLLVLSSSYCCFFFCSSFAFTHVSSVVVWIWTISQFLLDYLQEQTCSTCLVYTKLF